MTPNKTRCYTAALALLLTAAAAHAQAPAVELRDGQRVRITLEKQPRAVEGYTAAQVLRGEVTGQDAAGVMVRLHPAVGPAHVAWSAVKTLEVSEGIEAWYEGAWRRGRDTALLAGLQFFVLEWLAEEGQFSNPFVAGIVGAGIGMTIGSVLGAILPEEIWRRVELNR